MREQRPAAVLIKCLDLKGKPLEDFIGALRQAVSAAFDRPTPDGDVWAYPESIEDARVIVCACGGGKEVCWAVPFAYDGEAVTLDLAATQRVERVTSYQPVSEPMRLCETRPIRLADSPEDAGEGRVRSWVLALPLGSHHTNNYPQPIEVTAEFCAALVANFKRLTEAGVGFIADYNHNSAPPEEGEPRPAPEASIAAGAIEAVEAREDGLWVLVNWTARAVGFIRAGEYDKVSVEVWREHKDPKSGEVVGPVLKALALCNRPAVAGLPAVQAADKPPAGAQEVTMNEQEAKALRDEATAAKAQVQSLTERATAAEGKVAALTEAVTTLTADRDAKAGEVKALTDKVAALEGEKREAEIVALVDGTPAVTPANRAAALKLARMDRALFAEVYAGASPVQTTPRGSDTVPGEPKSLHELALAEQAQAGGKGEAITYEAALDRVRATPIGRRMELMEAGRPVE